MNAAAAQGPFNWVEVCCPVSRSVCEIEIMRIGLRQVGSMSNRLF